MERSCRTKKVIKLILIMGSITIAAPYLLDKLNFYGVSHAAINPSPTPPTNPAGVVTAATPVNPPYSYADAVALAAPAVVSIKTTKEIPVELNPLLQDPLFRQFFGIPDNQFNNQGQRNGQQSLPKDVQQGLGSGVIVSDKGYVLTNNHVIRDVDSVIVTLADGRTSEAKVIGNDPDSDLAVLQIKLDKLPVIQIGSSQKLRAGDIALAIGNPFGFDQTVTQGIISATERAGTDIGILENLIQTDAAINPGNSGGALIDATGRLIAINTLIYSHSGGYQGIGFAIPIDQAIDVMNKLIEGKMISRGFLGITPQTLNKEIREYVNYKEGDGVFIRAIVRGSPAQKAGLLPGDIIIKINNVVVKDDRSLLKLVASLRPGQSYAIEIFRKGDYMTFTVVFGERKQTNQGSGSQQNQK